MSFVDVRLQPPGRRGQINEKSGRLMKEYRARSSAGYEEADITRFCSTDDLLTWLRKYARKDAIPNVGTGDHRLGTTPVPTVPNGETLREQSALMGLGDL